MRLTYNLPIILLLLLAVAFPSKAASERTFVEINASNGLADNSAQTIVCTKTGRMVITTLGNINIYDGTQFTHINTDLENTYKLPYYHGHYHPYFDNNHHLWLKSSSGVDCADLMTESFVHNIDSIFLALGMTERVMDMFVDRNGQVWLVGKEHVYNKHYNKRFPILSDANLQDLDVVDNRRLLLIYGNGEVMEYDLETGKVIHRGAMYNSDDALRYNSSCVMLKDGNGYYVIRNGKDDGILMHYNLNTHEWKTILRPDFHLNNMALHNMILYIASAYGYLTYDTMTGEITHVRELTFSDNREILTDINDIEFDRQGGMWLGTEKRGVLYSRAVNVPFKALTWDNPLALKYDGMLANIETNKLISEYNGRKATCMFIDSRNWTWIGTPTGLQLYKQPQSTPIEINQRTGLMNNVIHSIIEDDQHNVWVSTSCGVSCIILDADTVHYVMTYTSQDNVPNETFVNGCVMKLEDGTIVMKGLDHVLTFNPNNFLMLRNKKYFKLYPKLTSLLVNGVFVKPGLQVEGNVVIDRAVTRIDELNLNYNQNTISMTFTGLNYIRPLQTFYRVRVKGLFDEWKVISYFNGDGKVDNKGQLHLPLTSLKPGTYEVELQASFFPDQWEVEPYRWIIHINEPWWRTSGMFVLLGILLGVLAIINFILYNRNTRLKVLRSNEEGDVIRRIKAFVERCDGFVEDEFVQTQDEIFSESFNRPMELSSEFIKAMMSIVPYVRKQSGHSFSMKNLCDVTGMNIQQLYQLVSSNIYKSPRALARTLMIQKAAEMLKESDKSIEEIASHCHFMSPNYFIASFYHQYKQTPEQYRKSLH
ncbi:MAG: AraC family transcriptional regulator [Prevotella sp.]|nr:AraC family transcriptional regulator [Prevotella sp.]